MKRKVDRLHLYFKMKKNYPIGFAKIELLSFCEQEVVYLCFILFCLFMFFYACFYLFYHFANFENKILCILNKNIYYNRK